MFEIKNVQERITLETGGRVVIEALDGIVDFFNFSHFFLFAEILNL